MIVNLELLNGDPAQVDVEMKISWRLKPTSIITDVPESDDDVSKCGVKEHGNCSKDKYIILSIDKLSLNN